MDCIFCKIVKKELPADIVYEGKDVIGFKDLNPEAPIHLLFVPKKHLEWKDDFSQEDLSILANLISAAKSVARDQNIFEACKLVLNIGKTGHVPHIHVHLLGGWTKDVPQHNI